MSNPTPEQQAKVTRHWVPVAGHLYVDPDGSESWYRVIRVYEGEITEWVDDGGESFATESGDVWPDTRIPCYWGDYATTDGLLRTARSAHDDPGLHTMPFDADHPSLGWRAWSSLEDCWKGGTEQEALIAAIEAAPEPK